MNDEYDANTIEIEDPGYLGAPSSVKTFDPNVYNS